MAQRKTPHYFSAYAQIPKGSAYLARATNLFIFVHLIWPPAGLVWVALCYFFQLHAHSSPIDRTVSGSSAAVNPQFRFVSNRMTPGNAIPAFITPNGGYTENISNPTPANTPKLDAVSVFAAFRRFQ